LWRPPKLDLVLFLNTERLDAPLFIAYSGAPFKPSFHIVPCGISGMSGLRSGSDPGESTSPASVAGEGVVGPCGPRTGNSSGMLPGSSSGRAGSPGSRAGGGTSGRGFPGGLSGGGSVGLPGVAGGISGGSIPIYVAIFGRARSLLASQVTSIVNPIFLMNSRR